MINNDYRCCSYCGTFMRDSKASYFFEHLSKSKFICVDEKCLLEYMIETHSKLNLIVSK